MPTSKCLESYSIIVYATTHISQNSANMRKLFEAYYEGFYLVSSDYNHAWSRKHAIAIGVLLLEVGGLRVKEFAATQTDCQFGYNFH